MGYTCSIDSHQGGFTMGAWIVWLQFLKRLKEADAKRREDTAKNPDAWRVPYNTDEYNADMKNWKGR
jgi:hypothetical protein